MFCALCSPHKKCLFPPRTRHPKGAKGLGISNNFVLKGIIIFVAQLNEIFSETNKQADVNICCTENGKEIETWRKLFTWPEIRHFGQKLLYDISKAHIMPNISFHHWSNIDQSLLRQEAELPLNENPLLDMSDHIDRWQYKDSSIIFTQERKKGGSRHEKKTNKVHELKLYSHRKLKKRKGEKKKKKCRHCGHTSGTLT